MGVQTGVVGVTNAATPICTMGPGGALVQNLSSAAITVGGPGVVAGQGPTLPGNPVPATPAIPASTVAAENTNPYPVQVVITGGTITAVVVNGITVGAAAGTYTVPAFGAISITYSVVPTSWAWTNASPTPAPVPIPGGQPDQPNIVGGGPVLDTLYGIAATAGPFNVAFATNV